MQYLMVFGGTESEITLKAIKGLIGQIKYEYNKKNESFSNTGKSTSYSTEKIRENILTDYKINILQEEGFSHIFFASKERLLFKGYTPQINIRERKYIDFGEIDLTEFYRWKIDKEDSMKNKSKNTNDAASSIVDNIDIN